MIAALPEGFHSRVAERGRNLSAGQRQLLALARAELADPDVLILDEATSSLDLATEAAVTRAELARYADHGVSRAHPDHAGGRAPADHGGARRPDPGDGRRADRGGRDARASWSSAGGTYAELWEAFAAGHEDGERETETAGAAI